MKQCVRENTKRFH